MKLLLDRKGLRFIGLVLAGTLLLSCKTDISETKQRQLASLGQPTVKTYQKWPAPDSYVGNIPVYDKFSSLEPLFRIQNDTTYVINFWATWCKPCLEELPYFEAYNAEMNDEKIKVILISLDFPKQLDSRLLPFVEKKQLKSQVIALLDGKYNDWIDKVSPKWSGAIPVTYIYKGRQNRLITTPYSNLEALKKSVEPFINHKN